MIPGEASAVLDMRLLPGQDASKLQAEIVKLIADPAIEVHTLLSWTAHSSPHDTPLFRAIEARAQTRDPGAQVLANVIGGFTDCNAFRAHGITCYGFMPLRLADAFAGIHGNDERIRTSTLGEAVIAWLELRAASTCARDPAHDAETRAPHTQSERDEIVEHWQQSGRPAREFAEQTRGESLGSVFVAQAAARCSQARVEGPSSPAWDRDGCTMRHRPDSSESEPTASFVPLDASSSSERSMGTHCCPGSACSIASEYIALTTAQSPASRRRCSTRTSPARSQSSSEALNRS